MNGKGPKPGSGDYVFKRDSHGRLRLVGDFEGYYRDTSDPWGQSGNDDRMGKYYERSRSTLIEMIAPHGPFHNIIEIGCGLGYVTRRLADAFPDTTVSGMDISATAAEQAHELFPGLEFLQGDIAAPTPPHAGPWDVIILNQMLWYILDQLDNVFTNCREMLSGQGLLIVSNAFLNQQDYGRDIIHGHDGLLDYCSQELSTDWSLVEHRYDDSGEFLHNDGVVILRRK